MTRERAIHWDQRQCAGRLAAVVCLSALALGWLLHGRTSAQTFFPSVRVVAIAAGDANTDFEVVFDKPVCSARSPATSAFAIRTRSTNHALLFSLVTTAFMSNLPVRVQTTDDATCHILSFELRR